MFLPRPQNQNLFKENRLLFEEPYAGDLLKQIKVGGEFDEKVESEYKKMDDELKKEFYDEIEKLEKKGKDTTKIKEQLKTKKEKMAKKAIDKALKAANVKIKKNGKEVQASYMDCVNSGNDTIKYRIKKLHDSLAEKYEQRVDEAVDQYKQEAGTASGKTKTRLQKLPKPLERDFDAENEETAQLEETYKKRQDSIIAKSKTERETVLERGEDYKARMEIANKMTSPVGGIIDDFDDGWFGDEKDATSITRQLLNGTIYAQDIFHGGKGGGKSAMEKAAEEAKLLFESSMWDHIFTREDLEEGMQMRVYLAEAKDSPHPVCQGVMAGLLKIADKSIADPEVKRKYKKHLEAAFKKAGQLTGEDAQLRELFKIKPISEFMEIDPEWAKKIQTIEDLTNPNRSGDDVIDDYPDTENWENDEDMTNEYNKTREALNGYLLAVNTMRSSGAMEKEYKRAFAMFEEVAGDMFEWEHLEKPEKPEDPDEDGFGLAAYLSEAKTVTKSYRVMGFYAGAKKLAEGMGNDEYREYVDGVLKNLSTDQGEEAQMAILSTIKSPEVAKDKMRIDAHESILDSAIEATKQHNLYKLPDALRKKLDIDPTEKNDEGDYKMSLEDYKNLADEVKGSINTFIDTRINDKKNGLRVNLQDRFNTLLENNKKLKEPLFDKDEIKEVRDEAKEISEEFAKAEVDMKKTLAKIVAEGNLTQLTNAEKQHLALSEKIDSMLQEIEDEAKNKDTDKQTTTPTPGPTPGPGGGPSSGPSEKVSDKYFDSWKNGETVTPNLGSYVGALTLDSHVPSGKVNVRGGNGEVIKAVPNGTEVTRTDADSKIQGNRVNGVTFIRVHWNGKEVWVAETLCFTKDKPSPTTPYPDQPKTPERPAPNASFWDQTFGRVRSEVETNPNGSSFAFEYNGVNTNCHVVKRPGAYLLSVTHPQAGRFELPFYSMDLVRNYTENGKIYQALAVMSLRQKRNWDTLRDGSWKAEIKTLRQTGDTAFFVEMDWKRNNVFETGNAKVYLNVGEDGRINYRVEKDNVGPDGEKVKTGFVSDMMQLQQTLSYLRQWSESYKSRKRTETFPAQQDFERRRSEVIDARTYDQLSFRIGPKYFFNNFPLNGYAFMHLDWDNAGTTQARNRSVRNPILEVKMIGDRSIRWKLINRTGPNGSWVGTQGVTNSINEMADQVQRVRANPASSMNIPAEKLYNLGGFGKSLYS